ncbi:hypothetical protein F5141DRAFT_619762 [Pisolithus sp. B1]|nr:hypothetical protein F5141DRAFT_619762 [Pisolithus sp. B1]
MMGKILFQAMTLSPWHPSPLSFSTETCLGTSPPPGVSITPTEIVRVIQSDSLRPKFIRLFPSKFGERLTDSRSLACDQFPDHNSPRDSIANLADKLGFSVDNEPLDWTPCYPKTTNPIPDEPTFSIPDRDRDSDGDVDLGWTDIDIWDRQGGRDKDVTLPGEQEVKLDSIIPLIEEVPRD